MHTHLTGIAGEPYAGKSAIAAHLATGLAGEKLLGREWVVPRDRMAIVNTDAGAMRQMNSRIMELGVTFPRERLALVNEAPQGETQWSGLRNEAGLTTDSLVVIDNLTGCVPDINSLEACHGFFSTINRVFTADGIGVVLVLHMTEKTAQWARKPTPLGSTAISANLRHVLYLTKNERDGTVEVTTQGNDVAERETLRLSWGGRGAADFIVQEQGLLSERRDRRSKATLNKRADKARWVITECQGKNKKGTAEALAAKFGGEVGTCQRFLQPTGPLGKLLEYDTEGHVWSASSVLST